MSDEKYTHLMDAIEFLHLENLKIMELVVVTTSLSEEDKKRLIKELQQTWDKEFQSIRKSW